MVKRALCVGCNYPSKAFGLAGAVNDAFLLAECLQAHCGFGAEDVCVLHDVYPGQKKSTKVDAASRPTRLNILQRLQWLVRSARPGDVLFFSFSGYGLQVDDMDGYQDEGYDEAILPTDFVDGCDGDYTVIVAGDIHDLLLGIPPGCSVTILMDCDHSVSVIDVTGTLSGELVPGLKTSNMCGLQAHTTKMTLANHDREVWQEERAREAKARPRFQALMEIDNPRRGRLPTRPAMSRSTPVAFCYSAASHGQTAMELQLSRTVDGQEVLRQHGVLSWCFAQALEELGYGCTYLELHDAIRRHMALVKEKHMPRMDQEVVLTFSTPLSSPSRMAALQPVELPAAGRRPGALSPQPQAVKIAVPPVVPPPPAGFLGSRAAAAAPAPSPGAAWPGAGGAPPAGGAVGSRAASHGAAAAGGSLPGGRPASRPPSPTPAAPPAAPGPQEQREHGPTGRPHHHADAGPVPPRSPRSGRGVPPPPPPPPLERGPPSQGGPPGAGAAASTQGPAPAAGGLRHHLPPPPPPPRQPLRHGGGDGPLEPHLPAPPPAHARVPEARSFEAAAHRQPPERGSFEAPALPPPWFHPAYAAPGAPQHPGPWQGGQAVGGLTPPSAPLQAPPGGFGADYGHGAAAAQRAAQAASSAPAGQLQHHLRPSAPLAGFSGYAGAR